MRLFITSLTITGCLLLAILPAQAQPLELLSPDGTVKLTVTLGDKISYDVACAGDVLMRQNELQLCLRDETLGKNPKLASQKRSSADTEIKPVAPFKFSTIRNNYNCLLLNFKGNYSVEFRAFDDGVAYRFLTKKKGTVEVLHEDANMSFPGDYLLHTSYPGKRGWAAVYEDPYSHVESQQWNATDDMSTLPVLIDTRKGVKILFSETDVDDYPCMFVKGRGAANGVTSIFPPAPLETANGENIRVTKGANYIARTAGARSFPWRWFVIAKRDGQLIESAMPAKLAPECAVNDVSWIKPGLVMWDYISRDCDFGPEVNYRVGLNNDALKHYIDFASRNKIPYFCIDAGWSKDADNLPIETIAEVDLPEIIRYAKEKNVDILLWMLFGAIQRDFDNDSYDLFDHFEKMGVKGFKIDFMDRSDQAISNFYERAARKAAEHHMVVELHGSFTPRGLEYKYPNVLSYEGVLGVEWGAGNCTPDNSLYLPFIRNVAGPMSFTPGIMFTVQPEHLHSGIGYIVVMIGTRAHHIAYYILFESGLQMIADSPRMFDQNPDCRDFIFATPVTWDETHALAADAGQYAVVARRHGDKWWIGGLCNGVEKTREFDLDLSFLPSGKTFRMRAFEDGPNSTFQAMDYNIRTQDVKQGDKLHIKLVRNGGFAAMLEEN